MTRESVTSRDTIERVAVNDEGRSLGCVGGCDDPRTQSLTRSAGHCWSLLVTAAAETLCAVATRPNASARGKRQQQKQQEQQRTNSQLLVSTRRKSIISSTQRLVSGSHDGRCLLLLVPVLQLALWTLRTARTGAWRRKGRGRAMSGDVGSTQALTWSTAAGKKGERHAPARRLRGSSHVPRHVYHTALPALAPAAARPPAVRSAPAASRRPAHGERTGGGRWRRRGRGGAGRETSTTL